MATIKTVSRKMRGWRSSTQKNEGAVVVHEGVYGEEKMVKGKGRGGQHAWERER